MFKKNQRMIYSLSNRNEVDEEETQKKEKKNMCTALPNAVE